MDSSHLTAREGVTIGLCRDCRHWKPPTDEARWDGPPDPRGRCDRIDNIYPRLAAPEVMAAVEGDHCGHFACAGDFGCVLFQPAPSDA